VEGGTAARAGRLPDHATPGRRASSRCVRSRRLPSVSVNVGGVAACARRQRPRLAYPKSPMSRLTVRSSWTGIPPPHKKVVSGGCRGHGCVVSTDRCPGTGSGYHSAGNLGSFRAVQNEFRPSLHGLVLQAVGARQLPRRQLGDLDPGDLANCRMNPLPTSDSSTGWRRT
jgi:hypothetical protein